MRFLLALSLIFPVGAAAATPQPQTVKAWDTYVAATEARIARELTSPRGFLVTDFLPEAVGARRCVVSGQTVIGEMSADRSDRGIDVPGGVISHWRGSIFLPGVALDPLLEQLQHPERGARQEEVLALRVLERQPGQLRLFIRMRRTKIVTVTYDTEHRVSFHRHGRTRASSRSVATRIVELDAAGTAGEREKPPGEDRSFLWRLNAYWRYEQVDGGVIVELESLTLSRSVPLGLGSVARPLIDRIARESIDRTLENIRLIHTPTAAPGKGGGS